MSTEFKKQNSLEPRIVLIRHGRSAHVHREGWIDAEGVRRWREAYDAAGVAQEDAPPLALINHVARAHVIVASDLPRATMSAHRLAPGRHIETSSLLRETVLEIPAWLPLRWPLAAWAAFIHLQWGYQVLRGSDTPLEEQQRATAAADWLVARAQREALIAAVTHGVFRRLLGRRLVAKGWRATSRRHSYRVWSAWEYVSPKQAA